MASEQDIKKRIVLPIIVYPLNLVFSPRKCTETITLVNENTFEVKFSLSTTRVGNKTLFSADITNGTIDSFSEEKITIEFKGNQDSPNLPIIITFNDTLSDWEDRKEIFWYFINNFEENKDSINDFNLMDDFDQFPTSHLSQTLIEDSKKLLIPLSLTIFIFSLINFSYAIYIVFFGPVDYAWVNLVNKYQLREISLRCSSWFEAHKLIHNFTCKVY